jgi:hypothetical protein
MGEKRNAYRILVGTAEDIGGRIILEWILDRMGWFGLD